MKCYKESHRVRKLTNILLVKRWKTVERALKVQTPSLWHTLIYTDAHHSSQSFRSLVCSGTVRKFLQNPLIYSDCHFANNCFDIFRTRFFSFLKIRKLICLLNLNWVQVRLNYAKGRKNNSVSVRQSWAKLTQKNKQKQTVKTYKVQSIKEDRKASSWNHFAFFHFSNHIVLSLFLFQFRVWPFNS